MSKRKTVFIVAVVALLAALTAFTVYRHATTRSLKVKVNPKNGGTVLPAVGTKRYAVGKYIKLTAVESDGYVFTGWSGASTDTDRYLPATEIPFGDAGGIATTSKVLWLFTNKNKVLTANFERFEPRAVQISNRKWMAENLNIVTGKSWCYDNDESNCRKYGRLYDYYTALDACPAGWRLPNQDDWRSLILTGGYDVGKKLRAKTGWWSDWPCNNGKYLREGDCIDGKGNGNGTDEYGFSALPAGVRDDYDGFLYIGKFAGWWINGGYDDWMELDFYNDGLRGSHHITGVGINDRRSIRCVRDVPGVPEEIAAANGLPSPMVQSWESGKLTVTFYANGLLRVSGSGVAVGGCTARWREYHRVASLEDCNFPWRFYPVTGVIIEDGVTSIENNAFDGCDEMAFVKIPNSVTSIEAEAFHYCMGLRSIIIQNSNPPKVSDGAFERDYGGIISKACLYVPANSIDAYRAADVWKEFGCIKDIASAPSPK